MTSPRRKTPSGSAAPPEVEATAEAAAPVPPEVSGPLVGVHGHPVAAARPTVGGRLTGDGVDEPEVFQTPAQHALQAKADADAARGYTGGATDATPDDHYSVAGVLARKPTPETERRS